MTTTTTSAGDEDSFDWAEFPLFAPEGTTIPNVSEDPNGSNATPALSALSHLLHDEETPEEVSELLREEGNRQFKLHGKRALRKAIDKYSAAVEAAGNEDTCRGAALNNRAAAELKLGNYGRALTDAMEAARLVPTNPKAHYRAAVAATHTEKLDVARQYVEAGLALVGPKTADANALRKQRDIILETRKRVEARAGRAGNRKAVKDVVDTMIANRHLTIGRAEYAQQREYPVTRPCLDQHEWCWPVLLVYTSTRHGEQSDYLERVLENVTMAEIVDLIFGDDAQSQWWDEDGAYANSPGLDVRVRIGSKGGEGDESDADDGWVTESGEWRSVPLSMTIAQLLELDNYVIPLYPVLHIAPKTK